MMGNPLQEQSNVVAPSLNPTPPIVSVVIPTYQRARYLAMVLNDMARQTLKDIEIIICDDGSTDDTPGVVAHAADPRIRYLRCDHLGMPRILNTGFAQACGSFIMTCHDHDIYAPTLLGELAGALERHPSAAYAHCGIHTVDPDNTRILENHTYPYPELIPGMEFLTDYMLPNLDSKVSALTMVRRSSLRGRLLDEAFGACADVELWLRLCMDGDVAYVSKPLIRARQRDSTSAYSRLSYRLTKHVLAAKKLHLSAVPEASLRSAIERSWRRGVDQVGLAELRKALDLGDPGETDAVCQFVSREGTRLGRYTTNTIASLPAPLARMILNSMRSLAHSLRRRKPVVTQDSACF